MKQEKTTLDMLIDIKHRSGLYALSPLVAEYTDMVRQDMKPYEAIGRLYGKYCNTYHGEDKQKIAPEQPKKTEPFKQPDLNEILDTLFKLTDYSRGLSTSTLSQEFCNYTYLMGYDKRSVLEHMKRKYER